MYFYFIITDLFVYEYLCFYLHVFEYVHFYIYTTMCYIYLYIHMSMSQVDLLMLFTGIRVDVTTKNGNVATGLLTHQDLEKR
jgi:hypothetical protein